MFGVETRAWSVTTPASTSAVQGVLDGISDPSLRTWLMPGSLAPIARLRRDRRGAWLRLSPGDPRRGPGSLDRAYVSVRPDGRLTAVDIAQRPTPGIGALLGGIVVGAWSAAALFGVDGLVHDRPMELLGVPLALGLRSFVELGRRCDERRLRQWLTTLLAGAATAPAVRAPQARSAPRQGYGAARYDVPAADCP